MDDRGGGANGLRTIVVLTSSVAADVYEIEEEPTGRIVRSTILFFNNLRLSLVTFNPGVRYRKSRPMEAAGLLLLALWLNDDIAYKMGSAESGEGVTAGLFIRPFWLGSFSSVKHKFPKVVMASRLLTITVGLDVKRNASNDLNYSGGSRRSKYPILSCCQVDCCLTRWITKLYFERARDSASLSKGQHVHWIRAKRNDVSSVRNTWRRPGFSNLLFVPIERHKRWWLSRITVTTFNTRQPNRMKDNELCHRFCGP